MCGGVGGGVEWYGNYINCKVGRRRGGKQSHTIAIYAPACLFTLPTFFWPKHTFVLVTSRKVQVEMYEKNKHNFFFTIE
jgi:hypothetical protein